MNLALDRKRINEAACLGFCPPAGVIVPRVMDFALQVEPPPYDPQKAKQLLAEAGYPNGLRRRRVRGDPGLSDRGRGGGERPQRGRHPRQDAADGARGVLRRLAGEEAARAVHDGGRQLRQRRQPRGERSSSPRAPTPTAAIPTSTSSSSSRRRERDAKKREALLHKIQQLTIDRVMYAPVMDLRALIGIGPRIAKHTITDIWMSPFPSYEDMELKN